IILQTRASDCAGTVQIGLIVAIRHNASWQPPQAYNKLFARGSSTLSIELHRTCEVERTHANKFKLCLKAGATRHDAGNEIVIRSSHSWTRAPSLSKRNWIVSIVVGPPWVVLKTSRRNVSSNT